MEAWRQAEAGVLVNDGSRAVHNGEHIHANMVMVQIQPTRVSQLVQ